VQDFGEVVVVGGTVVVSRDSDCCDDWDAPLDDVAHPASAMTTSTALTAPTARREVTGTP
jgi:hypothetical protein